MEILDLPALLPSDPPAVDSQIKKSQSTASSKKAEKKVVSKQLKGIGLRTPNRRLKQADAKPVFTPTKKRFSLAKLCEEPQPKRSSWWW